MKQLEIENVGAENVSTMSLDEQTIIRWVIKMGYWERSAIFLSNQNWFSIDIDVTNLYGQGWSRSNQFEL